MKTALAILTAGCVFFATIYIYSLKREIDSLSEIVEDLQDRNIPQLIITGKFPYIEAKKGSIIVMAENRDDNKSTTNRNR